MAELTTKPTDVAVRDHLAAVADDARRADCEALVELMTRVTGCAPVMWGPSIVGFDRYHYRYASGHEGDAAVVGFASGQRQLTRYLARGSRATPPASCSRASASTRRARGAST